MTPELNRIPNDVKSIHLIAVCGTAMGALASMLKKRGYHVTGSDQKMYPPMSDFLKEQGIDITEGFNGKNLAHDPDLVVVGNAVRKDNPEVIETDIRQLSYCSMPQALNSLFAKGKKTLLVTGTHGKTTTSSILAWVLHYAGLNPSFMIGGILKNFDSNYCLGNGDYIVIEGDEYDTAFFDKEAKFFHFNPEISILTGIEFDHADIFRDLDHIKQVFSRFITNHQESSTLIAYDNDTDIDDILDSTRVSVERYGVKLRSEWSLGNKRYTENSTVFEVLRSGIRYGDFRVSIPGDHNLMNILAVIAVAEKTGISKRVTAEALESFKGIRRRQDIRGKVNGVTVMDDFAHHPTAVRETIKAVKPFYPDGRIIAVFEPRTNTSMRDAFQEAYTESFDDADIICIRKPPLLEKIPENERFSSEKLVDDLSRRRLRAYYFDNTDRIIDYVKEAAQPGDLILVMSNGGFDNIHERLLQIL